MQHSSKDRTLIYYGAYLLLAGLAGFLSNPEKAKTALISGGTFGVLSILCGYFVLQGQLWGRKVGVAILLLLAFVFSWRSWAGWQAYLGGNADKLFAAALITSMLLATVISLLRLLTPRKPARPSL